MFDNQSNVDCFSYAINLDKPVEFFCKLIFEMADGFEPKVPAEKVFDTSFINEIGIRELKRDEHGVLNYSVDEVIAQIAGRLNSECLNDLSGLEDSNVLLVYRIKNLLFSYGDEKEKAKDVSKGITTFLKNFNVLQHLIDKVENGGIKAVLIAIKKLRYEEHYSNVVKIGEKTDVWAPYFPYSFFDEAKIGSDPIESSDIWVNKKRFKEKFNIEIKKADDVFLIKSADATIEIGIRYGDFVFPITVEDVKPYIKEEHNSDYYWQLFKDVYKKGLSRGNTYNDELLASFKKDTVRPELSRLLSFLVNNHYLTNSSLLEGSDFEKYFEVVSKIEQLQHINDFEFYVSNSKGKTALGIYALKKIGKSYNLLHWVETGDPDEKQHYFRNEDKPETKKSKYIAALKPAVAFYFISKYFEDLMDKVISSVTKDYIKNFELFIRSQTVGEIDFLIRTTSKIAFVEVKTKLTDEYIEQFIVKCDALIKSMKGTDIKAEFYIIGAYSDQNCERKRYFIDQTKKQDYNTNREALNTLPYYFKVPIPQHAGAELICIAEPEFDRLKSVIEEICKS